MTTPAEPDEASDGAGFLVIGESLVDLIGEAGSATFTASAGGSPFNVATGLAKLGRSVTFITEYGDDHCGQLLASGLETHGVDVRRHPGPTSIAIAARDHNRDVSYDFRFQWTLSADDVQVRGPFAALHVGSLACFVEPGRHAVLAAVTEAHRRGMVVSFDPNVRPALMPERPVARDIVEQFVHAATIVKASVEDVTWLYPGESPITWARRVGADGDRLVVLTDGPRGCTGVTSSGEVSVPATPVVVVDTVGAGDTFTAAILGHLHACGDLNHAARLPTERVLAALEDAVRAAAITCAHPGAYHPSLADVERPARPDSPRPP